MRASTRWVAIAMCMASWGCGEPDLTSARARLVLSTQGLDFGPTALGREKQATVTVTNEGRGLLRIHELEVGVPGFTLADPRPFRLTPGEKRELDVHFRPQVEGVIEGLVQLVTDARERSSVDVRGRGVRGVLEVNPQALDFGNVELDEVRMDAIVIENSTEVDAVARFSFEGLDADQFTSAEAGKELVLAAGQARSIPVSFRPHRLDFAEAAARIVACPDCEPVTVPITGMGIASLLEVSPLRVDFGRVSLGSTAEERVTIRNQGNEPLDYQGVALLSGQDVFSVAHAPPPGPLLPGGVLEVRVNFKPLYAGKVPPALLELRVAARNAASRGPKVPLLGEGGQTCVVVNPSSLGFGLVPQGMSLTKRFDVLNRCAQDVTLSDFVVGTRVGGYFSLNGGDQTHLIAKGGMAQLRVTFTPKPGSTSSEGSVSFRVNEGSRIGSEEVQLRGSSREFLPCQYRVAPTQIDFGLVSVGSSVSLGFVVSNQGTDACYVSAFEMAAGSDPSFVAETASTRLIEPGGRLTLLVRFRPTSEGGASGLAELTINHPTQGRIAVNVRGNGVRGCFTLQPSNVDFGRMKLACGQRARQVIAFNQCAGDVTLTSAALGNATSNELSLLSAPALPATLAPGTSVAFEVGYLPTDEGVDSAGLFVAAGQGGVHVAGLQGMAVVKPFQTDRFVQENQSKVDVLFVIDNSGSMMEEQQSLGQNFAAFMSAAQAQGTDYRIAVTTTGLDPSPGGWTECPGGVYGGEGGRFFPVDGSSPRIITPLTPNAAQVFAKNVQVGWCHWNEQGLDAAYRALSSPLINNADDPRSPQPNDGNQGFLREDAKLAIIFITDEEDFSLQPVAFYETFLRALKNDDLTRLSISAIVGPADLTKCPTASSSGSRYLELATATGGVSENICTSNWAGSLSNVSSSAFGPRQRFPLSQLPEDPAQLSVTVDGVNVTSGWTYDASTNSVAFDPGHVPPANVVLEIKYPLGC